MKNKEYINKQVEDTFKVLDTIEDIEVNHFFAHKVLQKVNANKEENKSIFFWFTPQLQFSGLCVLFLLNFGTIFYVFNSSKKTSSSISDIDIFAQEYALQSNSATILN